MYHILYCRICSGFRVVTTRTPWGEARVVPVRAAIRLNFEHHIPNKPIHTQTSKQLTLVKKKNKGENSKMSLRSTFQLNCISMS
jgi:hypothetical protein